MPCQVNWQSVKIKPHPSVHVLGAEAAAAGGVFTGMVSAAQASTSQEAPPAARITAAKMPSFAMRSLPGSIRTIMTGYKVDRQDRIGAKCSDAREFRSKWQPRHSHLEAQRVPRGAGRAGVGAQRLRIVSGSGPV